MTAAGAKIGILTVGRKRPGFDQEWNAVMRAKARDTLPGAEERVVVDEQSTRDALQHFHATGCSILVILQPSMGNGQLSMTIAQHWPGAIVLWATPERPDGEKVSSCSLVGQHLWASIFRQLNRPFAFVYGETFKLPAVTPQATPTLTKYCVGLLGAHAPGFLTLDADPFVLQNALGVQLQRLSLVQFFERVRSISEEAARGDARSIDLPMHDVSREDLLLNSRYYLALRELMIEESLDGLAIQDWPEFAASGHWPYLAMSRLSDEGVVITMEGDVEGAALSLIARDAGAGIGFVTDWLEHDERTIHFWHAGMAPLSWIENPRLGQHFNITKPLVVDGPLKVNQPMTIARLWRCDGRYRAMAFEGESIENPRKLTGNTASVEVDPATIPPGGAGAWFDTLLRAGLPHHVLLFRGRHREMLYRVMQSLSIDWIGR